MPPGLFARLRPFIAGHAPCFHGGSGDVLPHVLRRSLAPTGCSLKTPDRVLFSVFACISYVKLSRRFRQVKFRIKCSSCKTGTMQAPVLFRKKEPLLCEEGPLRLILEHDLFAGLGSAQQPPEPTMVKSTGIILHPCWKSVQKTKFSYLIYLSDHNWASM